MLEALHVYRNVFESKKYVEVYAADRIAAELGLDRARMAELALLLGSDYTEVGLGERKPKTPIGDTPLRSLDDPT